MRQSKFKPNGYLLPNLMDVNDKIYIQIVGNSYRTKRNGKVSPWRTINTLKDTPEGNVGKIYVVGCDPFLTTDINYFDK